MSKFTTQNEQLALLINHDFYLKLDSNIYSKHLTAYECMLLSFLSLSRECIIRNLLNPEILIFDYNEKIICNQRFNIDFKDSLPNHDANFTLELIQEVSSKRVYFMLQKKSNPDNVVFHWFEYKTHLSNFIFDDYRSIVSKIIDLQQLKNKYLNIHFELSTHNIDFEKGDWKIKKGL